MLFDQISENEPLCSPTAPFQKLLLHAHAIPLHTACNSTSYRRISMITYIPEDKRIINTCVQSINQALTIWLHDDHFTTNHSDLVLLQVDSLNTSICSVTRSGELMTWFNVHQSTRAEIRDSLMYHCNTVSHRIIHWEGTHDANMGRVCWSKFIFYKWWLLSYTVCNN